MNKENRFAPLLAPSTSSDVYIKDPYKSSRISYTRNFLLSLAKAKAGSYRTMKVSKELQLAMSCMYEGSLDLLPSPYSELDSVSQKVSASKVLDNVHLLHTSSKPYLPPCRNKALSSSGDSNGSLKSDISGFSECTNQEVQPEQQKRQNVSPTKFPKSDELWESYVYIEPPSIHDVQIQHDSELKSSNTSFEDWSSSISGFSFPDEDSLITYDGPFSTLEAEIPPSIDSFMSSPESNLTEDDLDSQDSTFEMIKSLIESVLNGDDDDYDDDYYNFDKDSSCMDDTMAELVQHGARVAKPNLSFEAFHSNQLNLGRGPFSLSSHSCPWGQICDSDNELKRFGLGADESMFQQGIMPSLEVPSWKEKTNLMKNSSEYQHPGYYCYVEGAPDSLGDGNGVIGSFEDRKLGESQFMRGFY
ncbi:hypothetical protein RYX36_020705 [Vicia faba]